MALVNKICWAVASCIITLIFAGRVKPLESTKSKKIDGYGEEGQDLRFPEVVAKSNKMDGDGKEEQDRRVELEAAVVEIPN